MPDWSDTADVVALWRLQHRYADVVTRRAWPELVDLFLPDAPIDLDLVTSPPRTIVGPIELGAFVGPSIERFDHFAFVILNAVVDVDPPAGGGPTTSARGRMFMCEVRHDPLTDSWPNAHGLYQDDYALVDGGWRFAHRRYRSLARQGPEGVILGLPSELGPL